MRDLDALDRKILAVLQAEGRLSVQDLSDRVGLSATPCWRRIRALEEAGVIRRRVALLDRDSLNVGVTVFVQVRTNQHNAEWFARFAAAVETIPEVVEFYRMAGEIDRLRRVVRAGASDNRHATGRDINANLDDALVLGMRKGRRFTGGADWNQAFRALGDLPLEEISEGFFIEASVARKRSHQSGVRTSQRECHILKTFFMFPACRSGANCPIRKAAHHSPDTLCGQAFDQFE